MELLNFRRNNYIYKEGEKPKYLYFIKEGDVVI